MFRFFNRYWSKPTTILLAVEATLLLISIWIAFILRFPHRRDDLYLDPGFWLRAAIFIMIVCSSLYFNGLYDLKEHQGARRVAIRLARSLSFAALALWTVYYVFPSVFMGRGVSALAFLSAGVLLGTSRLIFVWVLERRLLLEKILIVGSDAGAQELAQEILSRSHLGFRVLGFVDDDETVQGVSVVNPRVIGKTADVCPLAVANQATLVVVAQRDLRGRLSLEGLLACKTSGIQVERGPEFLERLTGKIALDGLRIKSWLVFSKGFVISPTVVFWKRVLDVSVALVAMLLSLPCMVLAALAIRFDSPGSILYRQERVGRDGKVFSVWKFRSMRSDAEAGGEARWAAKEDPRVTRVGRWIRKFRIDELPQLWNILVGDMSLVGPRPEREAFVHRLTDFNPLYKQRLVVRPGLTGWAQIQAPYAASFEESIEKLQFDLYYIKNMSVFLDLSILVSTIRIVLLGRGAQ